MARAEKSADEASGRLRSDVGSGYGVGAGDGRGRGSDQQAAATELRGLVDRFQRESQGSRTPGVVPVAITFPAIGPMVFLASELTAEGTAPQASFTFKRTVK